MHRAVTAKRVNALLSSWSLSLAGKKSLQAVETLEWVLCLGPGRSQGSPGPVTLRPCKPWKDPITSQYIMLS